jgi:hypothetical protein
MWAMSFSRKLSLADAAIAANLGAVEAEIRILSFV